METEQMYVPIKVLRYCCALAIIALSTTAASQAQVSSSANPSNAGTAISLSTSACNNAKTYAVSFYWGSSSNAVNNLIGTAQGFRPYTVSWNPPVAGTYYVQAKANAAPNCVFTSSVMTQTVNVPPVYTGYINPKYLVVGVTYAPPGPSSSVTYTATSALTNTASTNQTFMSGTTYSVSVTRGASIPKVLSGSITATYSTSFSPSASNSQGITLSQMSQRSYQVKGPSDPYNPVNHDYDVIWVWLNPVEIYSVPQNGSGSVTWNGYGFDAADQPDLDIYPMTVGLLNGHLGPNPYGTQLSRSWATGQNYASGDGPGLTQTDINNILSADPYANPSSNYTFTVDPNSSPATTTDGRFTLASNGGGDIADFIYQQAAPGGQPITQSLQNGYSTMSTLGSSMSTTTTQTFGIDKNISGSPWFGKFQLDLKVQYSKSSTFGSSSMVSNTSGSIDALSITGPPCGGGGAAPCVPTYTAPTEFNVYQDNQYGTFLFHPVR